MSMIQVFRWRDVGEEEILITVQAGTYPEKLSVSVEKSALLSGIIYAVKLNMKCFEHIYPTEIYFYESGSREIIGIETPLVFFHGKLLIARVKPSLYDGESNRALKLTQVSYYFFSHLFSDLKSLCTLVVCGENLAEKLILLRANRATRL